MILNKMNLSFENIQNFSKYDNKYCKLVYNMMVSPIDVYNLREVKFDALKEPMNLKVPSFEYGWHIEGDNGIQEILEVIDIEELLFFFFCILNEIQIVFVSEKTKYLSIFM